MRDFSLPTPVSDVEIAFPGFISHLIPDMDDIPAEFKDPNSKNEWLEFQRDWFFSGLEALQVAPKTGIDVDLAFRHLQVIQGSFQPEHEHKEAAVAYLASLWFDDLKYTKAKS